jgi:hypothetical protein
MDAPLLAKPEAATAPGPSLGRPRLVMRLPRTRAVRRRTALGALILGPMALGVSFALLLMVVAVPTIAGQLFGAVVGPSAAAATLPSWHDQWTSEAGRMA